MSLCTFNVVTIFSFRVISTYGTLLYAMIKASILVLPLLLFLWALCGMDELFFSFTEQLKTVSSKTPDRLAIAVVINTTKNSNKEVLTYCETSQQPCFQYSPKTDSRDNAGACRPLS